MPIGALIGGIASAAGAGTVASSLIGAAGTLGAAAIGAGAANGSSAAAQQAAAQNNALQQQIYQANTANETPFMQRGNAAGAQINALLGLNAPTAGTPGTQDWNGYLSANPDVANYYNSTPAVQQMFGSPTAYAQWHYQHYGQNEGRAAPSVTGGTPGQSATDQQNAAFDNFKNSTGYQFAFNQGQNAVNNNFALRGALGSGAAIKAQTEYGQQTALNNAFLPYINLLTGQQQTGLSAANALAGVGTNYANAVSNNNNNAASAAGNAAIASGNAWATGLGGLANNIQNLTGSSYSSPYSSGTLANYGNFYDSTLGAANNNSIANAFGSGL